MCFVSLYVSFLQISVSIALPLLHPAAAAIVVVVAVVMLSLAAAAVIVAARNVGCELAPFHQQRGPPIIEGYFPANVAGSSAARETG